MNILIWDIETKPTEAYVWRMWKENISPQQVITPGEMICWSAKWHGTDEVAFSSVWNQRPNTMVKRLHNLLSEADVNVTYNGNKFDSPIVNAAFARLGLAPPAPSKSVDMYQIVRKEFKFLSNRMDFVAKALGLEGKIETGGFELWVSVMNKDPEAQKLMEEYNIKDILVLEQMYERLLPWIRNHPSHAHYGNDGHVCPNCGGSHVQRRGTHRTKVSTFQRYQCTDCGSWSRSRVADKNAKKPEIVTL